MHSDTLSDRSGRYLVLRTVVLVVMVALNLFLPIFVFLRVVVVVVVLDVAARLPSLCLVLFLCLLDLFFVMIFGRFLTTEARPDKYQEKQQDQQRADRRQIFGLGLAVVARSPQELQQKQTINLTHQSKNQQQVCTL